MMRQSRSHTLIPVLSLCALALVPGCFDSHGRAGADAGEDSGGAAPDGSTARDAPIGSDAGACELIPVDTTLVCPSTVRVGEPIVVQVEAWAPGCCAADGFAVSRRRPTGVALDGYWDSCTCCFACECDPPSASEAVEVGVATSPGPFTVETRTSTCTIEVLDGSSCGPIAVDGMVHPSVVAVGRELPLMLWGGGSSGCDCQPRARHVGETEVALEICECSLDACVDPGYEETVRLPPSTEAGPRPFFSATGARTSFDVRDESTCVASTAVIDSLEQIAPHEGYGGNDTWIAIRGHDMRCCGEPLPLITASEVVPFGYDVSDCEPDPCDCAPGRRVDFTQYHHLGEGVPAGTLVRVGAASVVIAP